MHDIITDALHRVIESSVLSQESRAVQLLYHIEHATA